MSVFEGYLIKFGDIPFPSEYIQAESYKSTLQTTEIDSYKDSNNSLHRTVSPNKKVKIDFTTTPLNLEALQRILEVITQSYVSAIQKKCTVTYWDHEKIGYRTIAAFLSDIEYSVDKISDDNISYAPISISLEEY